MKTVSSVKPRKRKEPFPERKRVFHCNISFLRKSRGLSLRDVAEYSGVHSSLICRVESGLGVELATAMKLARFFETTVEKLWTLVEDGRSNGKKR